MRADRLIALLMILQARGRVTAQALAQAEWEAGCREMCAGLAAMRAAAGVAHRRYDSAASTNVRMWGQVS